jgi:hypothetical protein
LVIDSKADSGIAALLNHFACVSEVDCHRLFAINAAEMGASLFESLERDGGMRLIVGCDEYDLGANFIEHGSEIVKCGDSFDLDRSGFEDFTIAIADADQFRIWHGI